MIKIIVYILIEGEFQCIVIMLKVMKKKNKKLPIICYVENFYTLKYLKKILKINLTVLKYLFNLDASLLGVVCFILIFFT